MKKREEERITKGDTIRDEPRKRDEQRNLNEQLKRKEKTADNELIEAQMKREAGDRNRTQTPYEGNIEVTALNDPPVHRETRSMPRTSKAVTDALIKKPSKGKRQKSDAGDKGK